MTPYLLTSLIPNLFHILLAIFSVAIGHSCYRLFKFLSLYAQLRKSYVHMMTNTGTKTSTVTTGLPKSSSAKYMVTVKVLERSEGPLCYSTTYKISGWPYVDIIHGSSFLTGDIILVHSFLVYRPHHTTYARYLETGEYVEPHVARFLYKHVVKPLEKKLAKVQENERFLRAYRNR